MRMQIDIYIASVWFSTQIYICLLQSHVRININISYVCTLVLHDIMCVLWLQSSVIIYPYWGFFFSSLRMNNHSVRLSGNTCANWRKLCPLRFCRSHDTARMLKCSHGHCYANDLPQDVLLLVQLCYPNHGDNRSRCRGKDHMDADGWMGRDDRLNGLWISYTHAHIRPLRIRCIHTWPSALPKDINMHV